MNIRLTEIAAGIHQLTTYLPEMDFSLNLDDALRSAASRRAEVNGSLDRTRR